MANRITETEGNVAIEAFGDITATMPAGSTDGVAGISLLDSREHKGPATGYYLNTAIKFTGDIYLALLEFNLRVGLNTWYYHRFVWGTSPDAYQSSVDTGIYSTTLRIAVEVDGADLIVRFYAGGALLDTHIIVGGLDTDCAGLQLDSLGSRNPAPWARNYRETIVRDGISLSWPWNDASELDGWWQPPNSPDFTPGYLYVQDRPWDDYPFMSWPLDGEIVVVYSTPVLPVDISFAPSPDDDLRATPQSTAFYLRYLPGTNVTVEALADNPPGYSWLYWDFGGGDTRDAKVQAFIIGTYSPVIATYEELVAAAGKLCHFSCADGTIHVYYSDADNNLHLRIYQRSNGVQLEDFAITDGEEDTFPYAWQRSSGMQLYEECLFQRGSDIYYIYNPGGGIEGSWSEPEMAIAGYDLLAACDIPPQGAALILMLLDDEVYYAYANRAVDGSINWGPVIPALVTGEAFPTIPEQGASLEFGLDGKFTLTWQDSDDNISIAKSYDGREWGEM